MSLTVKKSPIEGLYEIEPHLFRDERGYFFESWSERDFNEAGFRQKFVQDNQSKSTRGVLRGLHYQKNHPQGKLIHVIEGSVFDVAVDLRPDSKTYGKWYSVILTAERQNMFYISPGFAHGFLVLSEMAISVYKCTDFYFPEDEKGLVWNDPAIGIEWPALDTAYLLSEKDLGLPRFSDIR